MTRFKLLLIIFLFVGLDSIAQNSCDDIEATTEVVHTQNGRRTGSITVKIEDDSSDIKLFLLNQGEEQAKKEIKSRKVENLKSGRYEFIVINTKKDKCYKYLSIQVDEKQ